METHRRIQSISYYNFELNEEKIDKRLFTWLD
jgi:hypothetical protein